MLYAIISEDVDDSLALRKKTRPAHLARVAILQKQGRIIIGGPYPAIDNEDPGDAGFTGSLIIAEFESLNAAKTWADEDPYVIAGVYKKVLVKPFVKVAP